ncbi:hypothetical protein NE237_027809 [Protea cynaroides]|uniref:Uncharacterized protein n=1 Tax=Protea cynaroides TaxID=273540 RepID=A0A9Q0GN68_9MAGN|nr:hypothetical protein NE237_027809 [Protea cynaroides]
MSSVPGSSNAVLGKGYGRGDGSLMLLTVSGLASRLEVVVPKIVRVSVSAFDDSRVESVVTESVRFIRVSEPFVFGSTVMPSPIKVSEDVAPSRVSSMPQVSSVLCDLQYGVTSQSIYEFGRVANQVSSPVVRSCNHGSDAVRVSIGPAVQIGFWKFIKYATTSEVIPPVSMASSILTLPPVTVPNGHVRSGVMNRVHSINAQQEVNGGRVNLGGFLGFPPQDATDVQNGRGDGVGF